MAFEPLKIEDLRLGMYVKLKCSWFKHPFTTNTFKVTSIQDLETIKKISGLTLYYDPDLSGPDSLPSSETLEAPALRFTSTPVCLPDCAPQGQAFGGETSAARCRIAHRNSGAR